MAHFYGRMKGAKGETSRLGTKASGLRANLASWQGCVQVHLYANEEVDHVRVTLDTHHGQGTFRVLYDGPVNPGKE